MCERWTSDKLDFSRLSQFFASASNLEGERRRVGSVGEGLRVRDVFLHITGFASSINQKRAVKPWYSRREQIEREGEEKKEGEEEARERTSEYLVPVFYKNPRRGAWRPLQLVLLGEGSFPPPLRRSLFSSSLSICFTLSSDGIRGGWTMGRVRHCNILERRDCRRPRGCKGR